MDTRTAQLQRLLANGEAAYRVETNTRHMIDKVLARYPAEHTVFRELLQNSNDAQATKAEIRFETTPAGLVKRVVYRNNGTPFSEKDWTRLSTIASGNPDETKIGFFGVGFYSVFAKTENPMVSSGGQSMAFSWRGDALYCTRGDATVDTGEWTEFLLDMRDVVERTPANDSFCSFLASMMLFMSTLHHVTMYVNDVPTFSVQRREVAHPVSLADSMKTLAVKTPSGLFCIISCTLHAVEFVIDSPSSPSVVASSTASTDKTTGTTASSSSSNIVPVAIVQATVRVSARRDLATAIQRVTKKAALPKTTNLALSVLPSSSSFSPESLSPLARAASTSLHGSSGRVYIGFPTSQTTGATFHLHAHVFPTIEREALDFADRGLAEWNTEMLLTGGMLARIAYEATMSRSLAHAGNTEEQELQSLVGARAAMDTFHIDRATPSKVVSYNLRAGFLAAPSAPSLFTTRGRMPASACRLPVDSTEPFIHSLPLVHAALTDHPFVVSLTSLTPPCLLPVTLNDLRRELESNVLSTQLTTLLLKWIVTRRPEGLPLVSLNAVAGSVVQGVGSALKGLWKTFAATPQPPTPQQPKQSSSIVGRGSGLFVECADYSAAVAILLRSACCASDDPNGAPRRLADWTHYAPQSLIPADAQATFPAFCVPFSISTAVSRAELLALVTDGWWSELKSADWCLATCALPLLETCDDATNELIFATMARHANSLSSAHLQQMAKLLAPKKCIVARCGAGSRANSTSSDASPNSVPPSSTSTVVRCLPTDVYLSSVSLFPDLPRAVYPLRRVPDSFLAKIGVRDRIDLSIVFARVLAGSLDWDIAALVRYLASVSDQLTKTEWQRLRVTPFLPLAQDAPSDSASVDTNVKRVLAHELYLPVDDLKDLVTLPKLAWPSGRLRVPSPEVSFLCTLGVRLHPPLKTLLHMCASPHPNSTAHLDALRYLSLRLPKVYKDEYNPAQVTDKIIPLVEPTGAHAAPSDCFISGACLVLGLPCVDPSFAALADTLGVQQHPPSHTLLATVKRSPPSPDHAHAVFTYLGSRLPTINTKTLTLFSKVPFIPVALEPSAPVLYHTPPEVFILASSSSSSSSNSNNVPSGQFRGLFPYADFGDAGNLFLRACGAKDEPSVHDIVLQLTATPLRFFEQLGLERYLDLLRTLAAHASTLSSSDTKLLAKSRVCVGFRMTQQQQEFDDSTTNPTSSPTISTTTTSSSSHESAALYVASELVLVDDTTLRRLFNVPCAPLESSLETFYHSLGAQWLSKAVTVSFSTKGRARQTHTSERLTKLLHERAPLIIHDGGHGGKTRKDLASYAEKALLSVTVVEVDSIQRRYSLRNYPQPVVQGTTASASLSASSAIVHVTASPDLYDVAATVTRSLFVRCKLTDIFLVHTFLETPLESLRHRGFPIDRVLNSQKAPPVAASVDTQSLQRQSVPPPSKAPAPPSSSSSSTSTDFTKLEEEVALVMEMFPDLKASDVRQQLIRDPQTSGRVERLIDAEVTRRTTEAESKNPTPAAVSRPPPTATAVSPSQTQAQAQTPPSPSPPTTTTSKSKVPTPRSFFGRLFGPSASSEAPEPMEQPPPTSQVRSSSTATTTSAPVMGGGGVDVGGGGGNEDGRQRAMQLDMAIAKSNDACRSTRTGNGLDAPEKVVASAGGTEARCEVVPGHRLRRVKELDGVPVFVERTVTDDRCLRDDVALRFIALLKVLARVYDVRSVALHLYIHPMGETVAFNQGGSLFFNLAYYEQWSSGVSEQQTAITWYLVMAHELAHNFVSAHDQKHEHWMTSYIERTMPRFVEECAML